MMKGVIFMSAYKKPTVKLAKIIVNSVQTKSANCSGCSSHIVPTYDYNEN